ncbi:MAG: hypothetical protein A2Y62_01840 [Candidatus Fischerbacteria bacterium RBG_13_37_8]|uniref:Methyltransferase type 11 domain-containing protein n=1 Tax=Candidatus Fischerbacteria bacterium RBG_13_37_8 TaxID=1817863 RepID=A0A1F5VDP8_9BACT|nr:MAG: hypothetical protein A2Y62_01840 [Candidatus Fischerbacteria bacterium RBG_13_37_8]
MKNINNMLKSSHKVSLPRWEKAQKWQLAGWKKQNMHKTLYRRFAQWSKSIIKEKMHNSGDDWNLWWANKFNYYELIPQELDNVIELGCGPYTNMRIILQKFKINHVVCSDPLVLHYVTFKGRWLAEAWKERTILIDDHKAEECPFASNYFDLTILINVLDHVHDALLCLRQAIRITKSGGHLIIGQDLTNFEDARRIGDDIGHPIRIDHEMLDRVLLPNFRIDLYKILNREEGRNPNAHYGTYIFTGKKDKYSEY